VNACNVDDKGNVGSKLVEFTYSQSRSVAFLSLVESLGSGSTGLWIEGLVEQRENGDTGTSYGGMTCTGRMDRTSFWESHWQEIGTFHPLISFSLWLKTFAVQMNF